MKFILIVSIVLGVAANAETLMTSKQFLKSSLSKSAKMSREKFKIDEATLKLAQNVAKNASEKQITFYYGKNADGKIQQTCTIVAQKGKEAPMSIGVCFDSNEVITNIEILEFAEERGQKARERSFLDQFKGKSTKSKLTLGDDVHGVSGATYTSEYISEALRKASFYFKQFVKGK